MNLVKFLRTPFLQNTSGRLLQKAVTGKSVLCDRSIYVLFYPSGMAVLYGNIAFSILLLSA